MTRFAILIATAVSLAATPGMAASYSAKPAVASTAARISTNDISWRCGPDACLGSTEESRPAILCQGLAKRAGRLDSFIADGRAFNAAELAKCNVSAKGGNLGTAAVANAN